MGIDWTKPVSTSYGTTPKVLSLDGPSEAPIVVMFNDGPVACYSLNGECDTRFSKFKHDNLSNIPVRESHRMTIITKFGYRYVHTTWVDGKLTEATEFKGM